MKVIGLTEFGGPEVLKVYDRPEFEPERGEVRITVFAASVNPADFYLRDGRSAGAVATFTPPYVPGIEVAGVISALGEGLDGRLSIGDRVAAHVMPLKEAGGGYGEEAITLDRWTVPIPDDLSFVEASTLPMNGMTALSAVERARVTAGSTVVVIGAPGAVGSNAVQLSKAAGARVIADAGPTDGELVAGLGADVVLDRGSSFIGQVAAAAPDGIDAVIDTVGFGLSNVPTIRVGGAYSFVAGYPSAADVALARSRDISLEPVLVTSIPDSRRMLDELRVLVEDGKLTLRVGEVLRPDQAAAAHRRLMAGGTRGRFVLEFRSEATGLPTL